MISQRFSALKDIALIKMVEDAGKLLITETGFVMGFELQFEILDQVTLIGDSDALIPLTDQLLKEIFFELSFGFSGHWRQHFVYAEITTKGFV